MVIVVTVIGVLAAIAYPKYADSMRQFQLECAAKRVAADLEYARQNARTKGTTQQVVFTFATSTYVLTGMTDPTRNVTPYTINLATSDYPATLVQVSFGTNGTSSTIVFDMYGRPDFGGSVKIGVGTIQRTINVDATGRVTIT